MDAENTLLIIKEMIKSNKIPGAFIFEDESGDAGNFYADVLAKAIVCQNTEYKSSFGEGCGSCAACKKADKGIHPDIILTESENEGNLSLHIDKVREIIDGLYLSPNESDKKVYIVRGMQNMTPQGQNALLKSIEEPPPFAVFIITVNNGDLILETVKSRAAKFVLDNLETRLKKSSAVSYSDIICDILKNKTDKYPIFQRVMSEILEKSDKAGLLNFYCQIENALRDILMAKIFLSYETPGDLNAVSIPFLYFQSFDEVKDYIDSYSIKKIINFSKNIHKFKANLDYNVNIRLNLTSFLSDLII